MDTLRHRNVTLYCLCYAILCDAVRCDRGPRTCSILPAAGLSVPAAHLLAAAAGGEGGERVRGRLEKEEGQFQMTLSSIGVLMCYYHCKRSIHLSVTFRSKCPCPLRNTIIGFGYLLCFNK